MGFNHHCLLPGGRVTQMHIDITTGRLISVWALASLPCLAGSVKSWVGKDADFSRYKTYEWLPVRVLTKTGVVENDEVAAPLIRAAVNRSEEHTSEPQPRLHLGCR